MQIATGRTGVRRIQITSMGKNEPKRAIYRVLVRRTDISTYEIEHTGYLAAADEAKRRFAAEPVHERTGDAVAELIKIELCQTN